MPDSEDLVPKRKRAPVLEIANQMYKDAFAVKKFYFSKLHPQLSTEQIHRITLDYFIGLHESPAHEERGME